MVPKSEIEQYIFDWLSDSFLSRQFFFQAADVEENYNQRMSPSKPE